MNRKILLVFGVLFSFAAIANAAPPNLEQINPNEMSNAQRMLLQQNQGQSGNQNSQSRAVLEHNVKYYPNANLKSGISKYKNGNYTGCLQELYALTKKDPSNAAAYYYMAMAYTHLGSQADAVDCYNKVIMLSPNSYLVDYATKGRDCLTGGPACAAPESPDASGQDDLDRFINSPYGNGLSPELNLEMKQKQLENIQETINKKDQLDKKDLDKIKEFDNKSEAEPVDKIASVSDEDILQAIKTLKEAGLTVNIQSPAADMTAQMYAQNPQMAEMSMLLGNNNNNNNNSMMNMIPFMMAQSQSGKNIDPRIMQAMIMNSMMPDFGMNNNDNNRY